MARAQFSADSSEAAAAGRRRTGGLEPRAVGAAVLMLAGTAAAVLAVVAGPGPGLTGYVSEAGVIGSAYAWTYRIGVFALGAALLLLAGALRDHGRTTGRTRPVARGRAEPGDLAVRAAVALLVAGAWATVASGAVACTEGCPLPPFEASTVADLVHGAASIVAAAATVLAMIAIVFSPTVRAPARRTASVCVAVVLPLAGALGLAMLFVGRGALAGVLERLLLLVIVTWGVVTAVILATGSRPVGQRCPADRPQPPG